MKTSSTLLVILFLLTTVSLSLNFYLYATKSNIVYVRSHDLIDRYEGTRDAQAAFEKKKSVMIANVDSLTVLFERAKIDYLGKAQSMSASQRSKRETELAQQQSQIYQYSAAIDEKIKEEDDKMMSGIFNQINSFVKGYAEEKNMDIILGTTLSGSLLYGEESMDITEQLLLELNKTYKGK
jgi:outer membrane protein